MRESDLYRVTPVSLVSVLGHPIPTLAICKDAMLSMDTGQAGTWPQ